MSSYVCTIYRLDEEIVLVFFIIILYHDTKSAEVVTCSKRSNFRKRAVKELNGSAQKIRRVIKYQVYIALKVTHLEIPFVGLHIYY